MQNILIQIPNFDTQDPITPADVFEVDPQNLIIKICDFGIACPTRRDKHTIVQHNIRKGTRAYAPPEFFLAAPIKSVTACDVWSLGAMLVYALTGRIERDASMVQRVVTKQFPRGNMSVHHPLHHAAANVVKKPCPWSEEVIDLIRGMLENDVDKRWTMQQILASNWLQGD